MSRCIRSRRTAPLARLPLTSSKLPTLSSVQTISTLPTADSERTTGSQIHLTPSGWFLYVGNRAANSKQYRHLCCRSRGWASDSGRELSTEAVPSAFCFDPAGHFLFVVAGTASGRLASYRINQRSGALTPLAVEEVGQRPCWRAASANHAEDGYRDQGLRSVCPLVLKDRVFEWPRGQGGPNRLSASGWKGRTGVKIASTLLKLSQPKSSTRSDSTVANRRHSRLAPRMARPERRHEYGQPVTARGHADASPPWFAPRGPNSGAGRKAASPRPHWVRR